MRSPKTSGAVCAAEPDPGNGPRDSRRAAQDGSPDWLAGPGDMRRRIREFDWSKHPLGSPEFWPQSLKTVIRMMLDSRYAMWMGWGSELTFFYNDAYARDTLGKKHPWALGRPAREVWAEIWTDLRPRVERVLSTGEGTWDEGLLLFLERSGYLEETYHTFSYSPLYNDDGQLGGMLCVVTEETKRVISERRLVLLRELGANTTLARTIQDACERFVQTIQQNPTDVPFALVYLFDEAQQKLVLKSVVQVTERKLERLTEIALGDRTKGRRPVAEAFATRKPVVISDLESRFGKFSGGKYPESPHAAVALPIPGADAEHPIGALVLGVNPRRALDDDYEGFFQLVAGQFAIALSNAQSYEKERQRAEALAELDRAKTAFFSNVSHEFRTPLTLMLGPLEELLGSKEIASSEQTHQELEVVHRNSLRLLKLVNTLLDFSRIEAGRIEANYQPTDLCAYTTELASAFRSTMEKAGLEFDVKCTLPPELVFVDRDMWEKIVFNLLSNAFKFTLHGGVRVWLASEDHRAVLRVSDTGTGIPAEELENVFKRFHRVQNDQARTNEGSGIGLALAHELVKLHGGSISIESKVGKGTTFAVSIPYGKEHLPADRVSVPSGKRPSTAIREEAFVEEASRWTSSISAEAPDDLVPPPATLPPGQKRPRVLVADDNADMREYITRLLHGRYELETVGDGVAALAAARRARPDLIISDIMMPGMDGLALLRAVREDESLCSASVIFLSARAGDEAKVEGIEQGADDYLVKPFSGRELLARVETHLKLARIRQKAAAKEKNLQAEAQAAREQLASVLSTIDELFIVLDEEWCFTYVNDRVVEVSGLKREELLGKSLWDVFPETSVQFHEELVKVAREKKATRFESFYAPWNRWLHNRVYAVDGSVVVLATDITERKQSESAAQRLAAIVESSDDVIISKDLNGIIASWNKGAERVFGYTAGEVIGKPVTVLMPPERVNEEPGILERIRRGERIDHYETVRRRKDGSLIDVSLTVSPIKDAEGNVIGASKVARDITDRVRAQEKLEQTVGERTASLREAIAQMEEFSYSVSHDLRAPVRAMKGYAMALLEDYGDELDQQGKEYLERIVQSGSRMDRLIRDVLIYSRVARQDVKLQPVDLDRLVHDILKHYPEFDPVRAKITVAGKLPRVIGHEASLSQIVSNLLNNAVKFVPAGKMPEVLVRGEMRDGAARLWIEDNGIGIKPEYQHRLFGMFERIHSNERYEGTGIGLAIVRKATERMGGKVGLESDGIHGSKFWIELPAA